MDLKTKAAQLSYRIEAKPEGGFRAVFNHSSMDTIEGSSREEVNEKVRAKLGEMIVAQLPTSFKIGGITMAINTKFNVSTRPETGPATAPDAKRCQSTTPLASDATPITPSSNTGKALRVMIAGTGIAALIFFLLRLFER